MRAFVCLWILTLAACRGDIVTEFPRDLAPLEENKAPRPEPQDGSDKPEVLSLVTGQRRDDTHWTHARSYVHAPILDTWAAFKTHEVVVDRREVDDWSYVDNVETGFDVSFLIHNTVHHVLSVDFDITWRESAVQGTSDAPELVAVRYQKTFGTAYIEFLSGSVLLRRVDDDITEIELIEQLKAPAEKDAGESYIRDLYGSVLAHAHGRPLPTYD